MFKILSKPLTPAILLRHVSVKKRKIRFGTFGSIYDRSKISVSICFFDLTEWHYFWPCLNAPFVR
jgi:hypothetical protein